MQIRVENVQFSYPGEVHALKGISFLIKPGEQVALVGENGSGKSTLARHLNGLLQPQSGFVQVGDWLGSKHSPAQMALRVAYVFQNPDEQIFKQKVWDEVAFGPRQLGFSPSRLMTQLKTRLFKLDWNRIAIYTPMILDTLFVNW